MCVEFISDKDQVKKVLYKNVYSARSSPHYCIESAEDNGADWFVLSEKEFYTIAKQAREDRLKKALVKKGLFWRLVRILKD